MPYQINIFNIKVNGISSNGNLDIGPTVHNSHTSNNKNFGVNLSLGDFSPSSSFQNTGVFDPDVSDQDQIANPSAPIANQI
ncbi:spore germination protein [Bacillus sp. ISL-35]|uniref:spore germination protein n=1 Tax=Bacillus sp. ISL-35 TaxID=2819122 RepID=UPI001BEC4556|nr:spore germination protein [Bacillus sp. ISL-35]MBT2678971.1 spore germination protein [Bacillus sp. ISL-35]MBT2703968.1 spore germination protein [Chryseobacterium sp. ISL-80]